MSTPLPKIVFAATPDLLAQIDGRGERSHVIRESLARYYEMLSIGRHLLRRRNLNAGDLTLLCHIGSSTAWQARDLGPVSPDGNAIAAAVADTEQELIDSFGVDRAEFMAHLRSLQTAEVAALIDSLERFWRATSTGMQVNPAGLLDEPAQPTA
jgi:hypothetical protein